MGDEQHVLFMESMLGGGGTQIILNVPNKKPVIEGLPEDVIFEVPVVVDKEGIHPEKIDPSVPPRVPEILLDTMNGEDGATLQSLHDQR